MIIPNDPDKLLQESSPRHRPGRNEAVSAFLCVNVWSERTFK